MTFLSLLLFLCSLLLPTLSLVQEVVRNGDKVKMTCPFLALDKLNYIYYPFINYNTLIDGKRENFNIFGANTSAGNSGKRHNNCADDNLKNEEKTICERLVPKIKEINRFGQGENARIVFEFEVSNDDGGNKLMCKDGLLVKQPSNAEAEIEFTVVDTTALSLVDTEPGFGSAINEGQAIRATCSVSTSGPSDAPLSFQVQTDSGWEPLDKSRPSTSSIELANVTAMRKHHGKRIRCVLGPSDNTPWNTVESQLMQIRFKPHGLRADVGSVLEVLSSDGSTTRRSIVCSAEAGNPPNITWSVNATVGGVLRPDVIQNQSSNGLSHSFDVLVEKDLEVLCIAQNDVGVAEYKIEIRFSTKPVIEGIQLVANFIDAQTGAVDLRSERRHANVLLICNAKPLAAKIKWFTVDKNNDATEIAGEVNREYKLPVLEPENHMDKYRCQATVTGINELATKDYVILVVYPTRAELSTAYDADANVILTIEITGNAKEQGILGDNLVLNPPINKDEIKETNLEVKRRSAGSRRRIFTTNIDESSIGQSVSIEIGDYRETRTVPQSSNEKPTIPNKGAGTPDGAVAGIIIAVILVILCAIILCVMWRKGLLCAKKDKGAGAASTAASTAGALDHAERGGFDEEDDLDKPGGVGVSGHVNPVLNAPPHSLNGYGHPDPTPDYAYATPLSPEERYPYVEPPPAPPTDEDNNDAHSDDSGVGKNGHFSPETGV